ncbi:MAG: hypothetical protein PQJ60_02635 [Spirochaetales bacterium]|nr:hypothetical protein [Spirochaetales bacterium]
MKGIVSFYEKPGCQGNAKQKQQLKDEGYMLQVVDMISKKWEPEELQKFLCNYNIYDCVNQRAPQVKSGEFQASELSEEELLAAMIESPILIKRPLIFFRGEFAVGFENDLVTKLLGGPQKDSVCHQEQPCTEK